MYIAQKPTTVTIHQVANNYMYIVITKWNENKESMYIFFNPLHHRYSFFTSAAADDIWKHRDKGRYCLKKCSFLSAEWTFKIFLNIVCCNIAVLEKGLIDVHFSFSLSLIVKNKACIYVQCKGSYQCPDKLVSQGTQLRYSHPLGNIPKHGHYQPCCIQHLCMETI